MGCSGPTAVALAFVAPSFVMVVVLAALYVRTGGLPWMQAAFYGIGAAVIALISRSAAKLVRSTAGRDWLLWTVVLANATITAVTARELLSVVACSGLLVLLVRWWQSRRTTLGPAVTMLPALVPLGPSLWIGLGDPDQHLRLFGFFVKAALVVFGSGLAIIPFLHGGVVEQYGWLTERQFLDAVAVAMITPGPVVITVAFIGYLVAGMVGASLAALGMFLPTYLVVVLMAPWFQRVAGNRMLKALVDGVTAAAVGALVGAVLVLGRRVPGGPQHDRHRAHHIRRSLARVEDSRAPAHSRGGGSWPSPGRGAGLIGLIPPSAGIPPAAPSPAAAARAGSASSFCRLTTRNVR